MDVVFGTHTTRRCRYSWGVLVTPAGRAGDLESLEVLPIHAADQTDSTYSGWVSISVGCKQHCTFCIVPALRGKEKDRRPGEVLAEVQALVDDGAVEVTLLGQNVNTYGVEFGDGGPLPSCAGLWADRGTEQSAVHSPTPASFTDDVIEAMARPAM